MKAEFFAAIMGVPNATGIWQWADMYNNGHLKIKMVLAKRYLLQLKSSDYAKGRDHWRIPEGRFIILKYPFKSVYFRNLTKTNVSVLH
jgi:hypothetical protein